MKDDENNYRWDDCLQGISMGYSRAFLRRPGEFSMEESWFPIEESWFPIEESWFPIEESWFPIEKWWFYLKKEVGIQIRRPDYEALVNMFDFILKMFRFCIEMYELRTENVFVESDGFW